MPIRTKQVVKNILVCPPGQGGGSQCSTISTIIDVPIRDWKIDPPQLNKVWKQGTDNPGQLFQDFTFPELEFVYPAFAHFKYRIKKNLGSDAVDFVTFSSVKLSGDTFNQNDLISERVFTEFKNLDNLNAGTHVIPVKVEAYGIDNNNQEVFLESFYTEVSVTVQAGAGIPTDKNEYRLTFNKADGLLSGDSKIVAYVTDPLITSTTDPFINLSQEPVNNQRHLIFKNNSVIQSKNVGSYTGYVTMQLGSAQKNVKVTLDVINDATLFYVNPMAFKATLQKNLKETKSFSADISNPNNLSIVVQSKPSFIESASIVNNVLKISTVNSSTLAVGSYAGEILLRAGNVVRKIAVEIEVVQAISHDFTGENYYFAKDDNKVVMNKISASSTYVKMTLKMFFNGFGEQHQEEQVYTFPFFKGSVEIFPGAEVQDFFIRAKDITTSLQPVYQFHLALVQMIFQEMNDLDEVVSTFTLDNIYFAPGRKPKCFPIFTDYPVRRTFKASIMKLSVDRLSEKEELVKLYDRYELPPPVHSTKFAIDQFTFLRSLFKSGYQNQILSVNEMQFIPIPDPEKIIHIEWENQNFVFDWFTAAGDFRNQVEIDNVLGESEKYREEKFDSYETNTITINSGWLLKSEIDLVTDILKSRLCFIYAEEKRYKCYPVGQKNLMMDTSQNFFNMDLDFKILKDEE